MPKRNDIFQRIGAAAGVQRGRWHAKPAGFMISLGAREVKGRNRTA